MCPNSINPFKAKFLYPLKNLENQWFPTFPRGIELDHRRGMGQSIFTSGTNGPQNFSFHLAMPPKML